MLAALLRWGADANKQVTGVLSSERRGARLHPPLPRGLWLEGFDRGMLGSTTLRALLDRGMLCGMEWQPTPLTRAIARGTEYTDDIRLMSSLGLASEAMQRVLTVHDAQRAADLICPVYEQTRGQCGVVTVEANPDLGYDADGMIDEVRTLWRELSRPNVMIRIHATREVLPAIRQLVEEGVNLCLTSILSAFRYREVAAAHLAGLVARSSKGLPVEHVYSFACFYSTDVDVIHNALARAVPGRRGLEVSAEHREELVGAIAALIRQTHQEVFGRGQFQPLDDRGARALTPLWIKRADVNGCRDDMKFQELTPLVSVQELEGPLSENRRKILAALLGNWGAWMEALDDAEEKLIKESVLRHDQLAETLCQQQARRSPKGLLQVSPSAPQA